MLCRNTEDTYLLSGVFVKGTEKDGMSMAVVVFYARLTNLIIKLVKNFLFDMKCSRELGPYYIRK